MTNSLGPVKTKVTKINDRYHCRLLLKGEVINEMACRHRRDIKYCLQYMMRMYDKCGYPYSLMADRSRHRKPLPEPVGKIWYPTQIPINKKR
jgi:hypothetical protein